MSCPDCDGTGIDASHEAALFYAARGELSPCPTCDGSGLVEDDPA